MINKFINHNSDILMELHQIELITRKELKVKELAHQRLALLKQVVVLEQASMQIVDMLQEGKLWLKFLLFMQKDQGQS